MTCVRGKHSKLLPTAARHVEQGAKPQKSDFVTHPWEVDGVAALPDGGSERCRRTLVRYSVCPVESMSVLLWRARRVTRTLAAFVCFPLLRHDP